MTPASAGERGRASSVRAVEVVSLLHRSRYLGVCAIALVTFPTAHAAAPTLDHLYPAGAGPGWSNTVALSGKFDPWPPRWWIEGEGVSVQAETNSGRLRIEVATNALPGPRVLRLFNDDGATEPRFFVVGAAPEIAEVEPNNRFQVAQPIPALPATVNGRLDKNGDVDSYAVALKGGQWLEARVDSHTLMSKVDAVLRVVTTNGVQLAWNHDFIHFDPRVVWQAPRDETVVVQVFGFRYPADASIQLSGGDGGVYRLHLAATPTPPSDLASPSPEDARCALTLEIEPNDAVTNAQPLTLPTRVQARIQTDGDVDRYRFEARKDELLSIRVEAAGAGSPLDAWCRIEDAAGKELAAADDSEGSRDPRLTWKAPADGSYVVAVGSTTHRGSERHAYRLGIQRGEPGFTARVATGAVVALADGTTNELKVTLQREFGHTNALTLRVLGLPEGVSSREVPGPAADGDVVLPIIASTSAPAYQGPIRVVVSEAGAAPERVAVYELVSRGENNGVPQGYSHLLVPRVQDLWLTVRWPAVPTNAAPATTAK